MKISAKIILTTTFISTLSVGGLARTAYATKIPSRLLATPQHHSITQVAEADSPNDSDSGVKEDGDREASDVKTHIAKVDNSSHTQQQRKSHQKNYRKSHLTRKHHST